MVVVPFPLEITQILNFRLGEKKEKAEAQDHSQADLCTVQNDVVDSSDIILNGTLHMANEGCLYRVSECSCSMYILNTYQGRFIPADVLVLCTWERSGFCF